MKRIIKKVYYKLISANKVAELEGVKFGKNCYFRTKNFGSEAYLIKIGDNVRIAGNVNFINHDGLSVIRTKYEKYKNIDNVEKITIGNNVFIGLGAIILKGTTTEDNIIIGAGSLVKGHLKANSIYAGVPVRYICSLEDYINKNKYNFTDTKHLNEIDRREYFEKNILG